MTFSILATSADGRFIGIAVATKLANVGDMIPHGSGLGGVIATQALLTPEYVSRGPLAVRAMEEGTDVETILDDLLTGDPDRNYRQVHLMDVEGNQAAYTGLGTNEFAYHRQTVQPFAGHLQRRGVSVAGNILRNPSVLVNMIDLYERTSRSNLSFPLQLLGALKAAENAGGDVRPYREEEGYSAALRVYRIGNEHPVVRLDSPNSPHPIDDLIEDALDLCGR